ncbi:MAG: type II toxin-antitoxin system prevent-host-death family antitoxin [Acidobacteriota bacterium]
MLQLRREAAEILRSVRHGESCILTYRGVPVARLEPLPANQADLLEDDPIYSLCQHAVGDGDSLSNEAIDDIIYG